MKIFETKTAPNPRRVRMFMAEKGLLDKAEFIEIDLQKGENRRDHGHLPLFRGKLPGYTEPSR